MRVIDSLGFSIKRRRRRTPNKENSRERMDKTNSRESNSFVLYWDIRKGMSIYCLREEKKYTSYSHRWIYNGVDFKLFIWKIFFIGVRNLVLPT